MIDESCLTNNRRFRRSVFVAILIVSFFGHAAEPEANAVSISTLSAQVRSALQTTNGSFSPQAQLIRREALMAVERKRFGGGTVLSSTALDQLDELRAELLSLSRTDLARNAGSKGSATGSISGRVRRAVGGTGLQGVHVQVYRPGGSTAGQTQTDAAGRYEFDGLAPDEYRLFARASGGNAVSILYDGINCSGGFGVGCASSDGTPVLLGEGAHLMGIDFEVEGFASISGVVRDEASGTPLQNARLVLSREGVRDLETRTSGDGTFKFAGVGPGEYRLQANAQSHKNRYFGAPASCDFRSGDLTCQSAAPTFLVEHDEQLSGFSFALERFGTVTGRLTEADTGIPIAGARITFSRPDGTHGISQLFADENGFWISMPLPDREYKITFRTSRGPTVLYPDLICETPTTCDYSLGTVVEVPLGGLADGIDAAIPTGGRVRGEIRDSDGNRVRGTVQAFNPQGLMVGEVPSDEFGLYELRGLAPGTVRLRAAPVSAQLRSEIFPDVACNFNAIDCRDLFLGELIPITDGAQIQADFELEIPATYRGRVTRPNGGALSNTSVELVNAGGSVVAGTRADSDGNYELVTPPGGPYYLLASRFSSSPSTVYPSVVCLPSETCDFTQGSPFTPPEIGIFEGFDVPMFELGSISGTVETADGGAAQVDLVAYSITGSEARRIRANGAFIIDRLRPGSYFVRAESPEYRNQLYANILCENNCSVTGGTPIPVELDSVTPGVNFSLDPASGVRVRVVSSSLGQFLGSGLTTLDASGNFVSHTPVTGRDDFVPLSSGNYRFLVGPDSRNEDIYGDQLYEGIDCEPSCNVTSGNLVSLASGEQVALAFSLNPLRTLNGVVRSAETGQPLAGIDVFVIRDNGGSSSVSTDDSGRWSYVAAGPGPFRVRTTEPGYANQAFPGIPCDNCPQDVGQNFNLPNPGSISGIDFMLLERPLISGSVTNAETGQPMHRPTVTLFDQGGIEVGSQVPSSGAYSFRDLDPGTYYVAASKFEFEQVLWTGVVCDPACDVTQGTPVVLVDRPVSGIDIALNRRASANGLLRDGHSLAVAQGVSVTATRLDGGFSSTVSSGHDGYLLTDLPTGQYQIRFSSSAHVDALLGGIECEGSSAGDCDLPNGQVVSAVAGQATDLGTSILKPLPRISGRLTDALSQASLERRRVELWNSLGGLVSVEDTDSHGRYEFPGLSEGTYFVVTDVSTDFSEYLNEIYDDVVCPSGFLVSCDNSSGTPLVLSENQVVDNVDFALDLLPGAVVRLEDRYSGASIGDGHATLLDSVGQVVASKSVRNETAIRALPGTYFLRASITSYQTTLWPDEGCEGGVCNLFGAQTITLAPGQTNSYTVRMVRTKGVSGVVLGTADQMPLAGVAIDLWDQDEELITTASTSVSGGFSVFLPDGHYYLSTDNGQDYLDIVYPDTECPDGPAIAGNCRPRDGDLIEVGVNPVILDITLGVDDILFRSGFE